jgi:hypothetical protein
MLALPGNYRAHCRPVPAGKTTGTFCGNSPAKALQIRGNFYHALK